MLSLAAPEDVPKSPGADRGLPIDEKIEPPSIVINMEPHPTPSASSIRSLTKKKSKQSLNDPEAEQERKMREKRKTMMDSTVLAMGHRLTVRKKVHDRL